LILQKNKSNRHTDSSSSTRNTPIKMLPEEAKDRQRSDWELEEGIFQDIRAI
jgi:hypothetical protein